MKATHKGTCQWCGNVQKLPNGRLAKHGYTTRWNFFEGVCRGAEELPYEQSCELVKQSIKGAKEHKQSLLDEATKLRQPATEPKAWIHEYVSCHDRRRGEPSYRWVYTDIFRHEFTGRGSQWAYTNHKGQPTLLEVYGVHSDDPLEIATHFNRIRVGNLGLTIKQVDDYIATQQRRVDTWQPQELIEL